MKSDVKVRPPPSSRFFRVVVQRYLSPSSNQLLDEGSRSDEEVSGCTEEDLCRELYELLKFQGHH